MVFKSKFKKFHETLNLRVFFFVFSILFWACKNNNVNQNYTKDNNGIYFKLLAFGESKAKTSVTSYLLLETEVKNQNDSVFFNSKHSTKNGIIINLNQSDIKQKFTSYFLKLSLDDSASFYIDPKTLFRAFFDTISPQFCKNDSIVKLNFKVKAILNKLQVDSLQNQINDDNELQELVAINNYLLKNYPTVKPDNYGIYTLKHDIGIGEKPAFGNRVLMEYQGFFLDGQPLDSAPQTIEYVIGTPDQLIKGLNIVIGTLKKGGFSKIIVPSRLAFGELGSSNQTVQPYTPLVYEIKLIDIK